VLPKRLSILVAIPFLVVATTNGQNQQSPSGSTSGPAETKTKQYVIAGAVNRPGSFPLARPTTVFDAINDAGGFHDFANKKDIKITRGEQMFHFNYDEYVRGKNRDQNKNIELEDGDAVQVDLTGGKP
jgi:protein involved in polysaccharide export with SLBB domain